MSNVPNGPTSGQVTDPSIAFEERVLGTLERIAAILQQLSTRLDAPSLEPDTSPRERLVRPSFGDTAHMALRDDGVLMVSLEDIGARSTEGRELVTFMVLTDDEADESHDDVLDGIAWAAAKIVGALPRKDGKGRG